MGTNYYLQISVCKYCGRPEETLHIGKSSMGWKFSFRIYRDEKINNVNDWIKLIEGHHNVIYDEYGKQMSSAEFIDLIDSKTDGKSHLDSSMSYHLINDYLSDGKYDYINHEFS